MTSCLYIANPFTKSRKMLNQVDLQQNVLHLKKMVEVLTNVKLEDQELLYFGEFLEEENTISSYGIKSNSTIFVTEKIKSQTELLDPNKTQKRTSIEEINKHLKKLRTPQFRVSLKRYLKDKTKMADISDREDIKEDYIVKSLLNDHELLLAIIDTATADSIKTTYPCLARVFEILSSNACQSSGRFPVSLNDLDDANYEGIDPALLAQAQLQASVEEDIHRQQNSSNVQQQQIPRQFSASDLANALSFATTLSSEGESSSVSSNNEQQINEALVQMRAVGITNDDLSRQALQLSGGNIEAAINLIFEGTVS